VESDILLGIGVIVVLGIGLQWVARLAHLPSIILLLAGGLVVGPGFDVVDADLIFGESLFPMISVAVGLLLFMGGLELRVSALGGGARRPVVRLVTLGAAVTWLLGTLAVWLVLDESWRVSALLAALLVVSGPTVVGPLLRLARPRDPAGTILQWEGVLIDPIGATLGLFVLNASFVEELTLREVWDELFFVGLAGAAAGLAAAVVYVAAARWVLLPDDLAVAIAVMLVVAAYLAAENVRPEAGLFAATVMGLALANQRFAPMPHLASFAEPVMALIIGSLFIVLASQVEPGAMRDHLPESLALAALLVLVVRPVMVLACTAGARGLGRRQRAFLACMAPRGVVAASTAALFSLRLEHIGSPSEALVPVTFTVIIALAIVYGFGAPPAARLLGMRRPDPRGLLLVGRDPWLLSLAGELVRQGVPAVVATRDRASPLEGD
jgi:NhaP-type Na+/H+ or K+/H+ antiporter